MLWSARAGSRKPFRKPVVLARIGANADKALPLLHPSLALLLLRRWGKVQRRGELGMRVGIQHSELRGIHGGPFWLRPLQRGIALGGQISSDVGGIAHA